MEFLRAKTEDRKVKAIEALLQVKKAALNGDYANDKYRFGICKKWDMLLGQKEACYSLVMKFSRSWEGFSGDEVYPIGGGENDFNFEGNLWTGKMLTLRLSLIDHMLTKMQAMTPEEIFDFTKQG